MKRRNRFLAFGIITALIVGVFTGCGTGSAVTEEETEITKGAEVKLREVNIGYVDTSGADILLGSEGIARDNGYFEEEFEKIGAKVNLVPMSGAGPAINEALAAGSLDIGILGDVPAVNGKAGGIDTTVISFSGLNSILLILGNPESGISDIKDLKGKKVATLKGSYMHRLLQYVLEDAGLTIDDIEFVNMPAQDALAALETKSVDAAAVGPNDVTYRLTKENGFKELLVSRGDESLASGTITEIRTDYLNENPDVAVAFLTAILRANEYIANNPDALKNQWVKAGYTTESYDYSYPDHENISIIEATDAVVQNAKNTLKFLQENDLNDGDFDVDTWYDTSYYEKALAEFQGK